MIIVDVETTGLNPKENSIVSIGAVDLSDPKRQFYIENRIWNGAEIYLGNGLLGYQPALSINGFSLEEINDGKKPALDEAMMKFINWAKECKEKVIGGNNPYFDIDFLKASAEMYNLQWPFGDNAVDLKSLTYMHQIQRGLNPGELKGKDCLIYVGLKPESIPHNALTGAKLKAEAISRILYGKNLLEEFRQYKIPEYLQK